MELLAAIVGPILEGIVDVMVDRGVSWMLGSAVVTVFDPGPTPDRRPEPRGFPVLPPLAKRAGLPESARRP